MSFSGVSTKNTRSIVVVDEVEVVLDVLLDVLVVEDVELEVDVV